MSKQPQNPVISRGWFGWVLSALICFLALASGPVSAQTPLRIAFISHAPDSDSWWLTVKNALKHASEDFDVQVDYLNPADGDLGKMAKLIENINPATYQAVIATIADEKLLAGPLRSLAAKKIPLVTVNSGSQEQSEKIGALMHIGQPDDVAGQEAGHRMAKAIPGVKSFICFNHYPTNTGSMMRCEGFHHGLGDKVQMTVVRLEGDAKKNEQTTLAALTAQPKADVLLALGPESVKPLLDILRAKSMPLPPVVTFDLSADIVTGIRQGHIAFAIDQQPYLQGYLSVGYLANVLRDPSASSAVSRMGLYANPKLHQRMARYGLELKPGSSRHINSGPGFVTTLNADKVERFSGQYR